MTAACTPLDLADGFAAHCARWAADLGAAACQAVTRAARAVSLATAAGHVCLPLDELAESPAEAAELAAALLASGVGGRPADGRRPLILDPQGRLYLHRYYAYERRLAAAIVSRLAEASASASPARGAGGVSESLLPAAEAGQQDRRAENEAAEGRPMFRRSQKPQAPSNASCNEEASFGGRRFAFPPYESSQALLDELFPPRPDGRADWQKLAVALALENRLTLISGGPGTGKTTTVVALLACLLAADPELSIALAAPTGKAAARMIEALASRAGAVPPELAERLPREAHTVHRLLGVTPEAGRFRHHAGNPLPVDVLVVDEASMLDLALATRLVEAVPPQARLILLGDKDQLAAVEAGAVFAELSASPALSAARVERLAALTGTPSLSLRVRDGVSGSPLPAAPAGPLADCVVWLTESHRFAADSGIGRLAALIREGDGAGTVECLAGGDPALSWLAEAPAFAAMQAGYRPYVKALRAGAAPTEVFAAFDAFRVLCPLREGPRSVETVNQSLTRWLRAAVAHPHDPGPHSPWFPGRPVMVLRNDPTLGLFNGDVGLVLPDENSELVVHFPDAQGGWRTLPPLRLPEHETALAMTVHKAQGSEFREVLVLLPDQPARVMSRELLYTAVTRARERVALAGPASVIEAACASPTRRYSGLRDRLAEAD